MIDRNAASRMRVSVATLDAVFNSAFGQREDSIIYTERNNYRVVVEVPQSRQTGHTRSFRHLYHEREW